MHKLYWACVAALAVAVFTDKASEFYKLLRLVVFIGSLIATYNLYTEYNAINKWVVAFAISAVLFNPVIRIYLSKGEWVFFDLVGCCLFYVLAKRYSPPQA